MTDTVLTPRDLEMLTISAFRYALGRATYIVSDTVSFLCRTWINQSRKTQVIIHREITQALEADCAGMECDNAQWRKILMLPLKEKGQVPTCWCGEPMVFVGNGAYPYDCIAKDKYPNAPVYESDPCPKCSHRAWTFVEPGKESA